MENEIWKDIVGYEGMYQVSNLGRVRRLFKHGTTKLLAYKMQGNRQTVRLRKKSVNGIDYWCKIVANLVAEAFIPKDEEWQDYVEHIDKNERNNKVSNLKWANTTNKEICASYSRIANLKAKNKVEYKDDLVYVELHNTKRIMICDKDVWEKHKNHTWNEHMSYAKTVIRKKEIPFHRLVLDCPDGYVIDHINRNRLDNRRSNLRVTTQYVNTLNRNVSTISGTGIKGVYKEGNKYRVEITVKRKRMYLGAYYTLEEAIKVRNEAEEKYHSPIIEEETLRYGVSF